MANRFGGVGEMSKFHQIPMYFLVLADQQPTILDLFKVIFYGLYQGKSPFVHKIWENTFGTFSKHRTGSKSKEIGENIRMTCEKLPP